jgi:hypothetical protein
MIGPTYLEDQNLGCHRELKYGGTLLGLPSRGLVNSHSKPTHLIGAASRNCCLTAWSHISTIDAQRVSVMVNFIPSAVILCTRDRGSVADSIEMRGRERARW